MSRQVVTVVYDDLTGDAITGDTGKVHQFVVNGVEYQLDLSDKNSALFEKDMQKWIKPAQRIGRLSTRRTSATTPTPAKQAPPSNREQTQAIRDWANANGHEVSAKGRVPKKVIDEFNEAHQPVAV